FKADLHHGLPRPSTPAAQESMSRIMSKVAENLQSVKHEIARAAVDAGRRAEDVTLVAVSKTFDAHEIRPALEEGQRVFGENRVQEAQGKWPLLREEFADIELHLIGPLQSN